MVFLSIFIILCLCIDNLYTEDSSNQLPNHPELLSEKISMINQPIPTISDTVINGWANFKLGKSYDEIVEVLKNIDFIELVPTQSLYPKMENTRLKQTIHIAKNNFFDRMQMHFTTNRRLYFIQMKLSKNLFSYNEIYKHLKGKYGFAQIVRSKRVIWSNATRKLILNRDNTVKYLAIDQFPLYTNSTSFSINQVSEHVKDDIFRGM